jgi:DNA-binding transcriptional LysR family regulator
MVQEGLDLSIRVGEVQDASLVARRIGSTTAVAVASEAYLAQAGELAHPNDLERHECIIFTRLPTPEVWNFEGADGKFAVPVHGRMRSNGIEAVIEAALAGVGVALVPTWMMRDEMMRSRLKPVLQAWRPPRRPISVVYPSRRFLAPRTRAVIDFLVDEFRLDPVISSYGEV